jgi:hypothetical protein
MKLKISCFFLFLSSFVFSQYKIQNLTSITLHKVYNEPDDGFCNSFISKESGIVLKKTVFDCDKLVLELIKLKSNLKNRKPKKLCCRRGVIGCPSIEYMITYQFNKLIDTIYFNNDKYEKTIIDYNRHREYNDTSNKVYKIISKNKYLKEHFSTNFEKIDRETFNLKEDTINVNLLKINKKEIYGLNIHQIEKVVDTFGSCKKSYDREIENQVVIWKLDPDYSVYNKNMNLFYFNEIEQIKKIIIEDGNYKSYRDYQIDELIEILGFKVGDNEKYLIDKFPNSTKQIKNLKKYFKDERGNYEINVYFENRKGSLSFVLNNGKIIRIVINLQYK